MKKTLFLIIISLVICEHSICQVASQNKYNKTHPLSIIWKEMRYNFAFPEKLNDINLDSLYLAYLPLLENAQDNYDFYRVLSSFMSYFDEAHTRIIAHNNISDVPPIETANWGTDIIVKNISEKITKKIPVDSRIISINDCPVMEYLKDSVMPYIGTATPHWKFDKAVSELLSGRPLSNVRVKFHTPQGKTKEITLTRDYHSNNKQEKMALPVPPPLSVRFLDNGIGYIHLSTCSWDKVEEIQKVFNANLTQILDCKGLIIDVRGNRGGSDEAWSPIANHLLTEKEYDFKGKWKCRIHSYMNNANSMYTLPYQPYSNIVPDSLKFTGPVVFLSGKYVGSATEDFIQLMKEHQRGLIVGEPTVGCIGEPMVVPLNNDFSVMLCAKKYVDKDGNQPNETGILPDVVVKQDYDSYISGKDLPYEYAISTLTGMIKENTKP